MESGVRAWKGACYLYGGRYAKALTQHERGALYATGRSVKFNN